MSKALTAQPEEENAQVNLINMYNYLKRDGKEDKARLASVVPSDRMVMGKAWSTWGSVHKPGITFFWSGWLRTIAQKGCAVSILGGAQKLSGDGPGQLALGDLAWAGGLDQIPQSSHSVILSIDTHILTIFSI